MNFIIQVIELLKNGSNNPGINFFQMRMIREMITNYLFLLNLNFRTSYSNLQPKMTTRKQGRGDETVQLVRRGADDEDDEGAALNANWN